MNSHLSAAAQSRDGAGALREAAPPNALSRLNEEIRFLTDRDLLRCPVDNVPLTWNPLAERLEGKDSCHSFPVQSGIPCLFAPNQWPTDRTDVTDIVQKFYEQTPFPNYDGLDSRDSLRRKARDGVVARLLDEQISHTATVLEVGCGTGQLSNFLGMGWGRTAIGADLCMNSLKLAKSFRDRCSINNAYFMQMNLFRPPFRAESFDVVVSSIAIHNVHSGQERAKALRSSSPAESSLARHRFLFPPVIGGFAEKLRVGSSGLQQREQPIDLGVRLRKLRISGECDRILCKHSKKPIARCECRGSCGSNLPFALTAGNFVGGREDKGGAYSEEQAVACIKDCEIDKADVTEPGRRAQGKRKCDRGRNR